MSDEWEATTLGTLFSEPKDRVIPADVQERYVGMEHMETGEPSVRRWGDSAEWSSLSKRFQEGDTLFGRLRPYLRKVALAPFGGVCSGEILVWRPREGHVLPAFLSLLASSERVVKHAVDVSAGSRMPRVSSKDLAAIEVVLPPIEVQQRIVASVGALDVAMRCIARELDAIERLRPSVAKGLPDADTARLGDVAIVSQGKSLPKSVQGRQTGDVSWFKIADMTRAGNEYGYVSAETRLTADEVRELRGFLVEAGSVVFPRVGAAVLTEKKRILEVDAAVDENHLVLTPRPGISPEVLLAVVENLRLSDLVQSGAVPSLNMGLIRNANVPWSDRYDEDLGLALGRLRRQAGHLRDELGRLRAVRAATLNALLSREIEIPESFDETIGVEGVA